MKDGFPVSVAELLASGERPVPSEVVAIVLGVCSQATRQPVGAAVPPPITPAALFIDRTGSVALAGGVPADDDQTVQMLGRLLLALLLAVDVARVPARLRELATRAAVFEGPRGSVQRLAASLKRFGPEHPQAAVRTLFERWQAARMVGAAARPTFHQAVGTADRIETVGAPESSRPRRANRFRGWRLAVGAVVGALLMLAGLGATSWLSADDKLPPLPLNPAILSTPPSRPARGGWELLDDPAGLAVRDQQPSAQVDQAEPVHAASASRPHADEEN
jgi:hypothetical protein